MDSKRKVDNKGKGILQFDFGGSKSKSTSQTLRVLIIGPSGNGKSTMIPNLLLDFPKPIKTITYIAPSYAIDDECCYALENILEKTKITWNPLNVDKNEQVDLQTMNRPEIIIFDDLYQNKVVEPLVNEIFTNGRKQKIHSMYLTQSPAFVPSIVRRNYTHLILNSTCITKNTDKIFELDGLLDNQELWSHIPNGERDKQYIIKKRSSNNISWYIPPHFASTSNIISAYKTLRGKVTEEEEKEWKKKGSGIILKKVSSTQEHKIKDGIAAAGNKNAKLSKEPIYKAVETNQIPQSFINAIREGNKRRSFNF